MKRRLVLLAVTIFIAFSPLSHKIPAPPAEPAGQSGQETVACPDYDSIINSEASWISVVQLDSGAIPMRRNKQAGSRVVPYFANITAIGLLEVRGYASNARKYMDWYFSHLNRFDCTKLTGTIYDYDVTPDGRELPLNKYDSVDSYASTFLSLARKYCEVTGDKKYLAAHKEQIGSVCSILSEMTSSDGLTWAKSGKRVKYLMNNCESFLGFKDAEWIYKNVYSDIGRASFYAKAKRNVAAGIEKKFWNESGGYYRYFIDRYGLSTGYRSGMFYPDATSQLYPVWTGMLRGSRASGVYGSFNRSYPGWSSLATGDRYPYALIAYAASSLGDNKRVDEFLYSVKRNFIDKGHPWPWYCMEAGVTILAAERMKKGWESRSMQKRY